MFVLTFYWYVFLKEFRRSFQTERPLVFCACEPADDLSHGTRWQLFGEFGEGRVALKAFIAFATVPTWKCGLCCVDDFEVDRLDVRKHRFAVAIGATRCLSSRCLALRTPSLESHRELRRCERGSSETTRSLCVCPR